MPGDAGISASMYKISIYFFQTVLGSAVSASTLVYLTSCHKSLGRVVAVYIIHSFVSLALLNLLVANPIVWLIKFIFVDCHRV